MVKPPPEAVIIVDGQTGIILGANPRVTSVLGFPADALPGQPYSVLFPPSRAKKYRHLFQEPRMRQDMAFQNLPLKHEQGHEVSVAGCLRYINLEDRPIVMCVFQDVAGRHQRENEVRRESKIESLKTLASNIAHDFNNMLTAILGNITMATLHVDSRTFVLDRLVKAEKACLRAQALTNQLLRFVEGGVRIKKTVSIRELLRDSEVFSRKKGQVRRVSHLPRDLWKVEVDKEQFIQVIDNLVANADQAMPQGGTLEVQAENIAVAADSSLPLRAGNYVKVTFRDQGVGIRPEHLDKIFEPFFTGTKKQGRGLGLATAYAIIKQHGGHITVESSYGGGSTFFLYLPAAAQKSEAMETDKVSLYFGQGKILLMDDEEMIREVSGEMLERLGYKVEFAREGAEAVQMYRAAQAAGEPFDAVILDLTVPGGPGGREAIAQLRILDPGVKALVSTGYADDLILADFKQHGFAGVIPKPYRIKELSEAVHRVLQES